MRIFFGHQSVGQNILDGLEAMTARPGSLPVVDAADDDGAAALLHARIGENGRPAGKIDDFVARLENRVGDSLDAALMKFCYADINAGTDIDGLAERYSRAVSHLARARPDIRLLHCTVPVRRMPTGARALARRVIRRPETVLEDNRARTRFNLWLASEYGSSRLFDLAGQESRTSRGRPIGRQSRGEWVSALSPAYTDDGGHLNPTGRRRLALAFSDFIAGIRRAGDNSGDERAR